MTFQTRALDLARAFQDDTHTDGSTFQYIPHDQPAWMLESVFSAHHDELPNDWRFAICRELAYKISNYETADNARDEAHFMADDAADICTGEILAWYAAHPGRLSYVDQCVEDYGIGGDTLSRLMAGQHYCIEQMVHCLIDACEARTQELAHA